VAFLSSGLFPWCVGGIQKHTCNLVREWARLGVDIDLYFAGTPQYPSEEAITEALFGTANHRQVRLISYQARRSIYFPLHHYMECYWDSVAVDQLLEKKRQTPDFIYVQGYEGLELFRRKRRGKLYPPIGVNLHGIHAWQQSWFSAMEAGLKLVCRPMERFMLRNCDVALSLGGRIDDIIRKVAPGTPIIRSANGISPDWLRGAASGDHRPLRVVFVGRNERAKGLHILGNVLREMQITGALELHVVSPIDKRDQLDAPWITYHGGISDEKRMRTLLSEMDVLVNPSRTEGVPTVVLEGMASGLAIIATDVGATCDLVGDDNGWLIKSNCPQALRAALDSALRCEPVLLNKKKQASLQKVKKYLWPNVAQETLRGIEEFLSKRKDSVVSKGY
jgi:glycosyltransferase involved in cell wall biosynthesis